MFKIEGKIEELEIQYIKNYFDDRAYTTVKYERDRKIEISLTMILMALGNFASAASLNKFENRKMNVSSFVKGKINGKPFYGWLGKTVIKENDYVEMVVIEKDNCYIAYAITLPEKRLIMITPECEYGRYYMVKLSVLGSIILGLIPFFFIALFSIGDDNYLESMLDYSMTVLPLFILIGLLFFSSASLLMPYPATKLTERIFSALGVKSPKSVQLYFFSIKTYKKLKIDELDDNDKAMLPLKYPDGEHFYFY
ncbi:putative type VI secretion system effector [Xenorhabdus szentirmaii]|nr:putative type VI secretion system effector [Xenorhabdus sp. 38]MBD2781776.1 hypothetical protein [Xenorhabdus sp. 38]